MGCPIVLDVSLQLPSTDSKSCIMGDFDEYDWESEGRGREYAAGPELVNEDCFFLGKFGSPPLSGKPT